MKLYFIVRGVLYSQSPKVSIECLIQVHFSVPLKKTKKNKLTFSSSKEETGENILKSSPK